MDLGIKGRNALVTGASRGIGRAIVELLTDEGCNVSICARGADGVNDAVASLSKKGVRAIGSAVDVSNLDALRGWVNQSAATLGGIDIFIANVSALAQGMDEESWRRGFEIDVMATVFGVEAAIPHLEKSSAGAVVVLGSTAMAEIYGPTRAYAAVKATTIPYVKGIARNLAAKNIRANVVSPGTIYFKEGVWGTVEAKNPDLFKSMVARNPMGRMGSPQEVANAVVFLASPRAAFITGTNLIVDGALTQRVQY